jgi:hypothetical protein
MDLHHVTLKFRYFLKSYSFKNFNNLEIKINFEQMTCIFEHSYSSYLLLSQKQSMISWVKDFYIFQNKLKNNSLSLSNLKRIIH